MYRDLFTFSNLIDLVFNSCAFFTVHNLSTNIAIVDKQRVWQDISRILKNQTSSTNYRGWFGKTKLSDITDTSLILAVPSAFFKNQLTLRYKTLILEAIKQTTGQPLSLEFIIDSSLDLKSNIDEPPSDSFFQAEPSILPSSHPNSVLNPRYTLENFVVGPTNNLAFAAAQAVIANPGVSYNPLFIYGPSGVGKTHLMQAIGNSLLTKNSLLKVIYVPSERFMVDFVDSIKANSTSEFRRKYRACHLFLVDDIQFISGKESTQEEFFHTFNELYGRGVQVFLTSDRVPNEIEKLEPRLASRFQGGLMVDAQLPDFETRMAILKAKLHERAEFLPNETLTLIAEQIQSTRELEGKLTQITQYLKQNSLDPTEENVRKILGNPLHKTAIITDHKKVLQEINQYFQIKMADLTGPKRQKQLVTPRHIAMFILHEDCQMPHERIGQILGGRDHTTIMHGVDKIRAAIGRDREVQKMVIEVRQSLTN